MQRGGVGGTADPRLPPRTKAGPGQQARASPVWANRAAEGREASNGNARGARGWRRRGWCRDEGPGRLGLWGPRWA